MTHGELSQSGGRGRAHARRRQTDAGAEGSHGAVTIGRLLAGLVFLVVLGVGAAQAIAEQLGWVEALGGGWVRVGVVFGLAAAGAAAFWLGVGAWIDRDIDQLRRRVEEFARAAGDGPMGQGRWWLRGITRPLNRSLMNMREQTDQLAAERRELEVRVRVSEAQRQHAEAILHSISDAVLVTDAFNEVALANPAAAATLGFELGEARRRPIDELVGDAKIVKLIRDMRESGNLANRRQLEHTIGEESGARTFDVTLACVGNAQHEVAGVVTILHDITREKEISEMKSDFVSSVSHELRTPLSSIKAYVEMLVDGEAQDEETRTEFYNVIQSETNRLSRLIDNILNINRIESGVVKIHREHVALPKVVKAVIDVMQPQARAKRITLTEKPTPLYFQVHADRDMIYQAILNLVGNAVKYTPEGGSVSLETEVDEYAQRVTIKVADTGPGIPEEALPHLFDKFYRVNDHKKLAKGTGLGLNLVKHIVETVHGGGVWVTSEVGVGSTFAFALPIADNADS
mgnify:CR=1 FL=1